MPEFSLGFSPCPNDTFIFHALVSGAVSGRDLNFRPVIEDVETLNRLALRAAIDVTKVSFHALGHIRDRYCLLRSGGALGRGCGPIVVSRSSSTMQELKGRRIAIPGRYTTAFLLLSIFDPALREQAVEMPFHRIMDAVQSGEADAGLVIHEGRFTFEDRGLVLVQDLGEWWEQETGHLIPLGCIVSLRSLGRERAVRIERLIEESIRAAWDEPARSRAFVKGHAQEMSDDVIGRHIGLYVNDFSCDLGQEGIAAVRRLLSMAEERGIIPRTEMPLLCDE